MADVSRMHYDGTPLSCRRFSAARGTPVSAITNHMEQQVSDPFTRETDGTHKEPRTCSDERPRRSTHGTSYPWQQPNHVAISRPTVVGIPWKRDLMFEREELV